jgi:hypothetical protein
MSDETLADRFLTDYMQLQDGFTAQAALTSDGGWAVFECIALDVGSTDGTRDAAHQEAAFKCLGYLLYCPANVAIFDGGTCAPGGLLC